MKSYDNNNHNYIYNRGYNNKPSYNKNPVGGFEPHSEAGANVCSDEPHSAAGANCCMQ